MFLIKQPMVVTLLIEFRMPAFECACAFRFVAYYVVTNYIVMRVLLVLGLSLGNTEIIISVGSLLVMFVVSAIMRKMFGFSDKIFESQVSVVLAAYQFITIG
jgi:hypothetical protein